ncbi:MAG: protein kinase [Planctomycetes bacterium]|nr:protein kinase [Planctomycetota bacterium]
MNKDPISSKETLVLPDALIGRKVGGYEIRGILGKGGMGVVYRTHDAALDREVALKLLPPALSADKEYSERFIREARMAAKLDHPRIVPVYAAGSSDQGAWIAMQLVKGRTLGEELHDGMRPTFSNVVKISRQTAEALGAAHKAGLIHRDIKPGNLIIDSEGNIKVLDFGLARPTHSAGYTQDGTYLGTPEYSSPEQCQTSDIDGRADLYSLGCVMYEMLGGRIPHVAETPLALFTKIVNDEPLALRDLNPKVPPSLAAIVSRLLAKNRDARYADAAALIRDLDKVVIKEAPGHSGETVIIGPADRARVAAWTLAGVLATLLVAAVVHSSPWGGNASGNGTSNATNSGTNVATTGEGTKIPVDPAPPVALNRRIVLLDFKNLSGDEQVRWLEAALPELIASSLATHEGLDPLEREDVTMAMKKEFNARLTSGGGDDVSQMQVKGVQLLAALDAGILVRGSFMAQGRTVRVMVTVLQRKGDTLERVTRTEVEDSIDNMLAVADHLAADISAALSPTLRESSDRGADGSRPRRNREEDKQTSDAKAEKLLGNKDTTKSLEQRLKRRRGQLEELRAGGEYMKSAHHGQQEEGEAGSDEKGNADPDLKRKSAGDVPGSDPAKGPPPATSTGGVLGDPKQDERGAPAANPQAPGPAETKPKAGRDDKNPDDPKAEPPAAADNHERQSVNVDEEKKRKAQGEDLLRALRKIADEIHESEKDLPEQELGAEGTTK